MSQAQVTASSSSTDDIVKKLKEKSFTALTFQEKKSIIDSGRPTPQLNISKQTKTC